MTEANFDKQYDTYFESNGKIETPASDPVEENNAPESIETTNDTITITNDETVNAVSKEQSNDPEETKDSGQEAQEKEAALPKDISNNLKAALKEERTKRQELEKQFKEQAQESAKIKEALQSLLKSQVQETNENIPDYNEDPIGFLKYQQDAIAKNQQQQQQFLTQQTHQQQQYNQAVALNNEYIEQREIYSKENPDFDNVAQFLENSVLNEYKALGYDDHHAKQLLLQDKLSVLIMAKEKNTSAPDLITQIAKARGYTSQPANNQKTTSNKLELIKEGLQKGKSLGNSGGQAETNKMSFKDIGNLTDKEWEGFWDKYKSGKLHLS